MYAMSTQRLSDHRSTAKVALAAVIFVSGLALGAVLRNNVATVAGQASVSAPALYPPALVYRSYRIGGNRLGETRRDTRIGFDNAHHVRQAAPQSLQSNAAMHAGREQSTVDTYHRHAMFFIRRLGGMFGPGGRLGQG